MSSEDFSILSTNMYFFAFTFLANNLIFSRTLLDKTNSDYLELNKFNYSTNVSPAIITPNYNVLYAPCPIDLTPLIGTQDYYELTLPTDIIYNNRFYVCQFVDLFTNNYYYVSSKTNKQKFTTFKIHAPDYTGSVNFSTIRSQSWYFLILLRVEINQRIPGDIQEGVKFEQNFILNTRGYTSSGVQLPNTYDLDIKSKKINLNDFYNNFLQISQYQNYFSPKENFYIQEFKKLGIYLTNYPSNQGKVIPYLPSTYQVELVNEKSLIEGNILINFTLNSYKNKKNNYWTTTFEYEINEYLPQGFEFAKKCLTAWQYIYANNKSEAIYWQNTYDEFGIQLNGSNNYFIRIDEVPPTNCPGFWSITAYTTDGYVYENPGQQLFTVGQGIDFPSIIYLSNNPPSNPESNLYLQTPPNDYYIILRLYNTNSDSYTYVPPAIQRA